MATKIVTPTPKRKRRRRLTALRSLSSDQVEVIELQSTIYKAFALIVEKAIAAPSQEERCQELDRFMETLSFSDGAEVSKIDRLNTLIKEMIGIVRKMEDPESQTVELGKIANSFRERAKSTAQKLVKA